VKRLNQFLWGVTYLTYMLNSYVNTHGAIQNDLTGFQYLLRQDSHTFNYKYSYRPTLRSCSYKVKLSNYRFG